MKIQVTQADLDGGWPCDSGKCPVARALERVFGCPVNVSYKIISVHEPGPSKRWRTPPDVKEFTNKFDNAMRPDFAWQGCQVTTLSTFEFELEDQI